MSPTCLITVLILESVCYLNVQGIIKVLLGFAPFDEAESFRNLEHMSIDRYRLWTIHREEGYTVCHLATDSLELD